MVQLLRNQHDYLESLPDELWSLVASLLCRPDFTAEILKNLVFCSLNTAMAFLDHRVIGQVRRLPLCLTQGDIRQNLTEFASRPFNQTWDLQTQKVWHCCRWAFEEVVRNLELLKDTCCSTQLAEKASGAAAVVHRYHRRLGNKVLQTRSFLGDVRSLLVPSRAAALVDAVHVEIDAMLRTSCGQRYSAHNAFNAVFWAKSRGCLLPGSKNVLQLGLYFVLFLVNNIIDCRSTPMKNDSDENMLGPESLRKHYHSYFRCNFRRVIALLVMIISLPVVL